VTVVGIASGLGNGIFMLPTLTALKRLGHRIALYVQQDFATVALWRRCIYADEILEPPLRSLEPVSRFAGQRPMCGEWQPMAWRAIRNVQQYKLRFPYRQSEWESDFRIARTLGWSGPAPDVSDWCRDLDRSHRWDIGIVPGSKGGVWLRKRWPGMAAVASHFKSRGERVAVFGLEGDGLEEIPGELVDTKDIGKLPDALAGCRLVIGTDSGVTHLASSLGVPVAVVFTATSELKGDPVGQLRRKIARPLICRPCQSLPRWQTCRAWVCRNIEPAEVIRAAEELRCERI